MFKLNDDVLKLWFYSLYFTNSLKMVLSQFKENHILLIYNLSTIGEYLPYHSKNSTWNLLHAYIDVHNQQLIDECSGDGVDAISRL